MSVRALMRFASMVTIQPMLERRIIIPRTIALALIALLNGCASLWINHPPPKQIANNKTTRDIAAPLDRGEADIVVVATAPIEITKPTNTWVRLTNEFTWPHHSQSAVRLAVRVLSEHKQHLQRASRRAEPYLWFIAETLKTRGMPAELALIPLIESGYRAQANSPLGAAGLWQFMPATGRRFGLKQTRWYDARNDIVASTHAALDYLEQLHESFAGSWLLAVAAYNCGPTAVRRAIKHNKSDDFWAISADLPPETGLHIPKLLAAVEIVSRPAAYGIALHAIPNSPWFQEVDLKVPLDLTVLTNSGNWSEDQFKRLNPAFLRSYTSPGGPFRILVPYDLATRIVDTIAAIPQAQRVATRMHMVSHGETLSAIATRYGIAINALRLHNKIRGDLIRAGHELLIPTPLSEEPESRASDLIIAVDHTVEPGDSLREIGRRYGVADKVIAELNDLTIDNTLQPGQLLRVRSVARVHSYDVEPGDSLWTIARKFNVTIKQLRKWNKLPRRKPLHPGQSLIVINKITNNV